MGQAGGFGANSRPDCDKILLADGGRDVSLQKRYPFVGRWDRRDARCLRLAWGPSSSSRNAGGFHSGSPLPRERSRRSFSSSSSGLSRWSCLPGGLGASSSCVVLLACYDYTRALLDQARKRAAPCNQVQLRREAGVAASSICSSGRLLDAGVPLRGSLELLGATTVATRLAARNAVKSIDCRDGPGRSASQRRDGATGARPSHSRGRRKRRPASPGARTPARVGRRGTPHDDASF
jgi:hypothetical protein